MMLSFAKNERGFRMATAAILLAPLACLVYATSRSELVNTVVALFYLAFAGVAVIAFLFEKAEEEHPDQR